ncbi:beta-defensin 125 [Lepus europaeus]|uniref:beta-defensin 125 n=1 Tax=Lepus europaeus TaxID=9983 RepID=UPI002B474F63|nr:beta-defensin 125 [Lepus europaeus]
MGRLTLTLLLCALLTQVTEGSWGIKRCWKNDVGHCRRRCLDDERYIRLCKNKLSCCISLTLSYDITRRPPPPVINIEDFTDSFDEDQFSASPVSRLSDEVTFFGSRRRHPGGGGGGRSLFCCYHHGGLLGCCCWCCCGLDDDHCCYCYDDRGHWSSSCGCFFYSDVRGCCCLLRWCWCLDDFCYF